MAATVRGSGVSSWQSEDKAIFRLFVLALGVTD